MSTQFKVLPASGGIYEQDPRLLREWSVISEEVAKVRDSEIDDIDKNVGSSGKSYTPPRSKSFSSGKVGGADFKRVPPVSNTFQRYHNENE